MVNASLNWASIVGIVLAVGGALLYFMRTFKPALARDYDVFFAAIGLLCGGILFFQGWRLDPILQFGQFLLAGTTVFFAYESVRLRGVATEQARRSAYFDDEPAPSVPNSPSGGIRGGWDENYDRFDEPQPLRRRVSGANDEERERPEDEFYRPRRTSRAAIPEQAVSRRRSGPDEPDSWSADDSERSRRLRRFGNQEDDSGARSSFGDRRNTRQDQRRGSRPTSSRPTSSRPTATRPTGSGPMADNQESSPSQPSSRPGSSSARPGIPQGSPLRPDAEDASFSPTRRPPNDSIPRGSEPSGPPATPPARSDRPTPRSSRPRDNNSRFDD
ncbi:MAG: Ycf66 family protein [Prochlorococcus sp.]